MKIPNPPIMVYYSPFCTFLLFVCVIMGIIAFFKAVKSPSESSLKNYDLCFKLPILAIFVVLLQRLAFELWSMAYVGFVVFKDEGMYKDRAVFLINISYFVLLIFLLTIGKFIIQKRSKLT